MAIDLTNYILCKTRVSVNGENLGVRVREFKEQCIQDCADVKFEEIKCDGYEDDVDIYQVNVWVPIKHCIKCRQDLCPGRAKAWEDVLCL